MGLVGVAECGPARNRRRAEGGFLGAAALDPIGDRGDAEVEQVLAELGGRFRRPSGDAVGRQRRARCSGRRDRRCDRDRRRRQSVEVHEIGCERASTTSRARCAWTSSPSTTVSAATSGSTLHQSTTPTRRSGRNSRRWSVAMPSEAALPKWALTNSRRVSPDVAAHSAYWRTTAASSSGVERERAGEDGAVPVAAARRRSREAPARRCERPRLAQRRRDDGVGTVGRCGPCCSMAPTGTRPTRAVRGGPGQEAELRPRRITPAHLVPPPPVKVPRKWQKPEGVLESPGLLSLRVATQ